MAIESQQEILSSLSQPYALHLSPLVLAGPTAVGKSEVALLLAEKLRGEIISVDSMQVYRGLDIGTAKPSASERARVPHHLIDVVEPDQSFDAAQFVSLAHGAVREVQARGHVPILCGGTGLYFKVFLEGLGEGPRADPQVRAQLETTPLPDLLAELAERDPVTFEKIERQNPRRVIRAVEVVRLTGKSYSTQRARWDRMEQRLQSFGMVRPIEELRRRIDSRVDEMFRLGLVEETERLLGRGLAQNKTAMQAIGYRQTVEFLHAERSLEETISLVKTRTRQFAKRQMTWFRRQMNLTWIDVQEGRPAISVAEQLANLFAAAASH